MDGFGPIVREENEPVFHAEWEKRLFGLAVFAMRGAGINIDEFRHAIERLEPRRYLSPYYDRWRMAIENLMVEKGVITTAELASLAEPEQAAPAAAPIASPLPRVRGAKARFKRGDRVRARNLNPQGHTRIPRYVRGKTGIVRSDYGLYVFPDTNAHHAGDYRQHVYSVEFRARELWGETAPARDTLRIDLWENYLEPAERKTASRARRTR